MISGNSFGSIHLLNHDGDHALKEQEILNSMGVTRLEELVAEQAIDFALYRGNSYQSFVVHNNKGKAIIKVKVKIGLLVLLHRCQGLTFLVRY